MSAILAKPITNPEQTWDVKQWTCHAECFVLQLHPLHRFHTMSPSLL